MNEIRNSLFILDTYCFQENYIGYDPYDTLNSWIPFNKMGKWIPILATQFQKRNPLNIRPLLGIKREINPKAFGLFLHAYSLLYRKTGNKVYLDKANYFFNWLKNNYSKGYSGYCWGYNFPWANPNEYKEKYTPSTVVTGFVCRGIFEYFKLTSNLKAKEFLISAANFVLKDIPMTKDENGICFSYTPLKRDLCFNSSLLAAEILTRAYILNKDNNLKLIAIDAVNWVISHQKENGRWNYSKNIKTGREREQIDFHQGYVLDSIFEIKTMLNIEDEKWESALNKGTIFYRENQFTEKGISYWRYPKRWPIEIHNQTQGIITFLKLYDYYPTSIKFSKEIANWTINNMQAKDGHFYYQKFPFHTNKISYMRWSNAWMFLALAYLVTRS